MSTRTRIRHTLEKTGVRVNLTGGEYRIRFPRNGIKDVGDPEYAAELVESHPLVEWASEIPEDYQRLQQLAAAADTDTVDGNSEKADIVAYLETLSHDDLEALKDA
jgi:hypothetical protein